MIDLGVEIDRGVVLIGVLIEETNLIFCKGKKGDSTTGDSLECGGWS
jgi:hypothetical protein